MRKKTTTQLLICTVLALISLIVPQFNQGKVFANENESLAILADGKNENELYNSIDEIEYPAVEDYKVFDKRINNYIEEFISASISVGFNNGDFFPIEKNIFNAYGKYNIKYEYSYFSFDRIYTVSAERNFYVYTNYVDLITVGELPQNTKCTGSLNDGLIYIKALCGVRLDFPVDFLVSDRDIMVTFSDGQMSTNITDEIKLGIFSYTPETSGTYVITAIADDENYGSYIKRFVFVVKEKWYDMISVPMRTVEVGDKIENIMPVIVDFYGNRYSDVDLKVLFNNKEITSTVFDKSGIYTVTYYCNDNGEELAGSYEIRVRDTTKPVLNLSNKKTSVKKGEFVSLDGYIPYDNSGMYCSVEISVKKDNENIALYNKGFLAESAGNYEITYKITDTSGNENVYIYTVQAHSGLLLQILYYIIGGVVLLGGTITVVVIVKKKQKKQ